MYVRRKSSPGRGDYYQLVENQRVDGKPPQRVILHLRPARKRRRRVGEVAEKDKQLAPSGVHTRGRRPQGQAGFPPERAAEGAVERGQAP